MGTTNGMKLGFTKPEPNKEVEEKVSLKTKLQDSLLILYKMNASMELIFMIKSKLKKYK